MKGFKHLSNKSILLLVLTVTFIKIIFYIAIKNGYLALGLGGGNDSDYYHAYAMGYVDIAVNIWPMILRSLNDISLYSREGISYIFLFSNLCIIPHMVARLAGLKFKENQKYYLYFFLLCLIYPSLFYSTFDIYRDVFMVLSFLSACFVVKKCIDSSNILVFVFLFVFLLAIGLFLLALRPYLGYAFLLAIFLWKVKLTKKRLILFSFLYFIALFTANYLGAFDVLIIYRDGFAEMDGGSNLGLDFSNPLMFVPNFILSILGQLFGLYITNPLAIIIFFIETVPFFFMLVYIIKNIKLADNFVRFLIVFFVLYASVWLIGNDNLGTALRLRFYNYLSVYICFFYILRLKNLSLITS